MTKDLKIYLKASFFACIRWALLAAVGITIILGILDSVVMGIVLLYEFFGRALDCFAFLYTFDIAKCDYNRIKGKTLSEHISKAIPSALVRAAAATVALTIQSLITYFRWGAAFYDTFPVGAMIVRVVVFYLASFGLAFLGELLQYRILEMMEEKKNSKSNE